MKILGKEKINPLTLIFSLCFPALVCIFSYETLDPALVPRYVFISISTLIIVLLLIVLKKGNWGLSLVFLRSKWAFPYYVFLLFTIISTSNASAFYEGLFTLSSYILFFILLLVFLSVVDGSRFDLDTIIKGIVIGGIAMSAFGFYQLYQLKPNFPLALEESHEIKSTLAHKNLFASAALFTLIYSVYTLISLSRLWKILGALSAISSIFFLSILQARSALLALVVVLLAWAINWILVKKLPRLIHKLSFKFLLGTTAFLVVLFTTAYFIPKEELKSANISAKIVSDDERSFTIKERSLLWEGSMKMIFEESYFGVGPGNWKIHFPNYGSGIWRARQGLVQFQRPHNDYLWVLSESGILGFAGWILFIGSILLMGLKLQLSDIDKNEIWMVQAAMAVIIAYMVVAFFSFPRERMIHQWILMFSFSVILSIHLKSKIPSPSKSYLLSIIASVILIAFTAIGFQRFEGEKITQKILADRKNGQWIEILEHSKTVENLAFYDLDPTGMPMKFYSGLAHFSLENYDVALNHFQQAYLIHPFNIHVINNLAGTHQVRNDYDSALIYYNKAVKIAPYYKDGILNLAAAYFNNNQPLLAYGVLNENNSKFDESDEAYQVYLITILRTICLNILSANPHLQTAEIEITDEWLLNCHNSALAENNAITNVLKRNFESPTNN